MLLGFTGFATHKRAGEIVFRHLSGFKYEITVITYQNTGSTVDNPYIIVHFGNGDSSEVYRSNGNGDSLSPLLKKNLYTTTYTYSPGTYTIWTLMKNRNANIVNMDFSEGEPLILRTQLQVGTMINNSVVMLVDPIDSACLNNCYYHNPAAMDPDGDSLSYQLISCSGSSNGYAAGYYLPAAPNGISIDPVTGDLTWCSPYAVTGYSFPQMWNFAILIKEWRRLPNGTMHNIGWVIRDMQVNVVQNCNNQPPLISAVSDICVQEGDNISFMVSATDPQATVVTLSAAGEPFGLQPPASFVSTPAVNPSGNFSWTPGCEQVRLQPYLVVVKARDSGPTVNLVDIESFFIRVVAKGPQDLKAFPSCGAVSLTWRSSACDPQSNPVTGYLIYIDEQCNNWMPSYCETGVPAGSGYSYLGFVSGLNNTTFTVSGLVPGNFYSFRVVTKFLDGSLSLASQPLCIRLPRLDPVITHVDVMNTSSSVGSINIRWMNPLTGASDFDTLLWPGPYTFNLYRGAGYFSATQLVFTYSVNYFSQLNILQYTDGSLNTDGTPYVYKAEILGNGNPSCAASASSVYLTMLPSDNTLTLNWSEAVPWTNTRYYVWKETAPSIWILIDSTSAQSYTDPGLVNGVSYCYYVESRGAYSDPLIPAPLLNRSEIRCAVPLDLTAPCAPSLNALSACEDQSNHFSWTDPNQSCADDVVGYHLWFMADEQSDPIIIAVIMQSGTLTFTHDSLTSVAGCYFITALDSFNNESAPSNRICLDNCPIYELPNVFTPNGDGQNDFFIPLPYRYVESIELTIYDRWGMVVFESRDPDIHWSGNHIQNGKMCSDGVYYYTCKVYEKHLKGLENRILNGYVHLLSAKP